MMSITGSSVNLQGHFQALPPDWPGGFWWHWLLFTVIVIGFVLTMVMGVIYIEGRGMGRMQSRLGPNRTGPFGLLQPVADAIKVMLKENIVPDSADKLVHWLAPVVAFIPALIGKFTSNLVIAYSGRFSLQIIRDIFGGEGEGISAIIGTVLGFVLLIVVFVIMFKVDWEKRFAKYVDDA